MHSRGSDSDSPIHHHEPRPIDDSYRIVVRTILWVIAGALVVGIALWWFLT